jgi:hypothetical protein
MRVYRDTTGEMQMKKAASLAKRRATIATKIHALAA